MKEGRPTARYANLPDLKPCHEIDVTEVLRRLARNAGDDLRSQQETERIRGLLDAEVSQLFEDVSGTPWSREVRGTGRRDARRLGDVVELPEPRLGEALSSDIFTSTQPVPIPGCRAG